MSEQVEAAGYIIQDIQSNAIHGFGDTVDEAWQMVVDSVGSFSNVYGNTIDPDLAYETQFKTYGATARLMNVVAECGGNIAWRVVFGIACTPAEAGE